MLGSTAWPRTSTQSAAGFMLVSLLTAACGAATGEQPPDPDGPTDTDEDDDGTATPEPETCSVEAVFERNGCLSCHGDDASLHGGGVRLTEAERADSLVGVASQSPGCADEVLINADDPAASVLLHTVAPDAYAGAVGEDCRPIPMPLGTTEPLPEDDVACLEQWIATLEAGDTPEPDETYVAPPLTVLTRVKYLLDGGAVTADELALATGPEGELREDGLADLVETWMNGERFSEKRRQFLELQLQQTPGDGNYYAQFRNTRTNNMEPVRDALNASLVRTAERIMDDGEDFRTIATTNTWEVTTTTLLALKMADNPMVLKPNGAWPKNNAINDIRYVTGAEVGLYDREADSSDWRTVTLVHNPDSTDMTTEEDFVDPDGAARLRAVPDGGVVELRTPRIGFFSSPAFFQTWQTNRDNDFRVTISQALIVATGLAFSAGDTTPLAGDDAAVDPDVFPRDSTCYGCHKNLDVMRPAFLSAYDHTNTRHTVPEDPLPEPGFSFQGQSEAVASLQEWAEALSHHPNFALAWTLKLCQWASSASCSATDPQVVTLAEDFAASGHDLTHLFADFFSSPLVTRTSDRLDSTAPGAQVSVARAGHYCHAMSTRLDNIRRAQGHDGPLPDRLNLCRDRGPAALLAESLPRDQVVRGSTTLHQPRDHTAMVSVAFEGICASTAPEVVSTNDNAAVDPSDPDRALALFNELLLGFPPGSEQHLRTEAMLVRYFRALTAAPACATPVDFQDALLAEEPLCGLELSAEDALRDLWTMACQSPSLTGVGP